MVMFLLLLRMCDLVMRPQTLLLESDCLPGTTLHEEASSAALGSGFGSMMLRCFALHDQTEETTCGLK